MTNLFTPYDLAVKLKAALLQLKEYSSNELVITNDVEYNIDEQLEILNKPILCPNCNTKDLTIIDNESLSNYDNGKLDDEVYVSVRCEACKQNRRLKGEVNYNKFI